MEGGAARAVAVAERRRRSGVRSAGARTGGAREGGERRGAGDAVGGAGRRRPAARRTAPAVRGAEAAVDAAAREPVGLERELQRGDVPAAVAGAQRAAADRVAALARRARGACAGRRSPSAHEPAPALDAAHAGARARAREAVDRPGVDAVRAQRDLQRGDARAGGRSGRGGEKARRDRRRRHPCPDRQQHSGLFCAADTRRSCCGLWASDPRGGSGARVAMTRVPWRGEKVTLRRATRSARRGRGAQVEAAQDRREHDPHLHLGERGAEAAAHAAAVRDPRVGRGRACRGSARGGTRTGPGRRPGGCGRARSPA